MSARRLAPLLSLALSAVAALALGESPAPSSPVYVPSGQHPRFRHQSPAHAAESCTRCHAPRTLKAPAESLMPTEASCTPCHATDIDRGNSSARCAVCHEGRDPKQPFVPEWSRTRAELRFSHASHTARGTPCSACHGGSEQRDLPSMAKCLDCHKSEASRRCSTCHLTLPDGKLRTRLDNGALLRPASGFLGMAHDSDWGVRHRWVAADQPATCQSCHAARDCRRCHDGRRPPSSVHPNDFLSLHAQDARREPARCARCHSAQTFCMECHSRLGIALNSPPDLRGTSRYHPPAAEWTRGPNRHALEARRALSACVSCHAENDCVACHAAPAVGGGGVSPHPKSFFDRCGRALATNPRACRTCHGDLDALRARCP